MQYQPVKEDSFAKESVKLVILPFVCVRGSTPLGECRKIECSNMLTLRSLTKNRNQPNKL